MSIFSSAPSAEVLPRSLKISSCIRPLPRTESIMRLPKTSLRDLLKSASISRMARNLASDVAPGFFSIIAVRPTEWRVRAKPFFRGIVTITESK